MTAPHWFELLAWVALALGFASALLIAADIALLGNRQHMAIMDLVFPLTALWATSAASGSSGRAAGRSA